MNNEELVERSGFHDSELTAMQMQGDRVRLRFEDVSVDFERRERYRVTVELGGVRRVTRDGEAVDTLHLEDEASDVLRFERSGNTASLILEWISYTARTNRTCAYGFVFDAFDLTVERQEPGLP